VLLLAPAALASVISPPAGAALHSSARAEPAVWVGNETTASNEPVHPGDAVIAFFALHALAPSNETNATRYALVNVSGTVPTFAPTQLNLTLVANSTGWVVQNVTVPTSADAQPGPVFFYNATVYESTPNATVLLGSFGGSGPNVVASVVTAPAPFLRGPVLVGGGIVLLLAVALGAYGLRQRNLRRRMRGRTRSQALQEIEREEAARKPEQAAQVQQEIRQQEQVRTQRRELQILEAKRADAQKGIELLKKRHEMGALSKLQHDTMVAKRQAELARIEPESAATQAEGEG